MTLNFIRNDAGPHVTSLPVSSRGNALIPLVPAEFSLLSRDRTNRDEIDREKRGNNESMPDTVGSAHDATPR